MRRTSAIYADNFLWCEVNNFFSSNHRPSQEIFNQAYNLVLSRTDDVKQLITDIFSQLILDIEVLPTGQTQDELLKLVEELKK